MTRTHLLIRGTVQGVWYRASTVQFAQANGLNGWVRNLTDGRVEAVFEGPREQVEAAVAWCHQGPERAVVTGIARIDNEPVEGLQGFDKRPTASPA